MKFNGVKLIYFSPTKTTQTVLGAIAKGMAPEKVEHIDLTPPESAQKTIPRLEDKLVIMGAPVYGGRLPADAVSRFRQLSAKNSLAVLVVMYGNREFEDALLELKDLSIELGFTPLAGAAFIGEHSFCTKDSPIALGRPDSLDIKKAMDFGAGLREKAEALPSFGVEMDLEIPGRFPYEGGARSIKAAPVTKEDLCTVCGACAEVCPKAAISINDKVVTDTSLCIRCSACIKICPEDARVWEDEMVQTITKWLNENCQARKEPQIYGMDMP
jgi:ferredoxin